MKIDNIFTYMTKTLHDTERTEKVVPHLANKSPKCSKNAKMERYIVEFIP